MKYIIYTDGSSRGNPGPGGWGAVIKSRKHKAKSGYDKEEVFSIKELGGREDNTTNNRMELTAVIKALEYVRADHSGHDEADITLHSDSEYVIKGMTQWIDGWKRKNWKNSAKKPVLNKDLWEKLDEVSSGLNIDWKHVRGHVGIAENERCDEIATSFADGEIPRSDLGEELG